MNLNPDFEVEIVEEPEDVRHIREVMEEPLREVTISIKFQLPHPVQYYVLDAALSKLT